MAFDWTNFGYDIGASQINALSSYLYSSALMDKQNEINKDYSTWNYTNANSLQRQGLEKAGYNPILAVNNGSTYSGGSAGLGSVNVSDSHMGTNASQVSIGKKQTSIQEKAQQSQANLNLTQEDVNNAQQLNLNAQTNTEWFKQQNLDAQTANYNADTALINVNKQLAQKDLDWKDKINLMTIKTRLQEAQAAQAQAAASKLGAQAQMVNAKSTAKFNARRSGGFSSSWSGKGFGFGGSYSKSW